MSIKIRGRWFKVCGTPDSLDEQKILLRKMKQKVKAKSKEQIVNKFDYLNSDYHKTVQR